MIRADGLLVLSCQLPVLRYPERYAKTEALGVGASDSPSTIKLENILNCQAKYWEAVMVGDPATDT
jgi:hypothetical protein